VGAPPARPVVHGDGLRPECRHIIEALVDKFEREPDAYAEGFQ
jgi:hypothetical protein